MTVNQIKKQKIRKQIQRCLDQAKSFKQKGDERKCEEYISQAEFLNDLLDEFRG